MTQEEKAKRYNEVLESIKELYSKGSRVVVSKEEFENIFPELKESEDENVRQAMINFFKSERIKNGIAVLHFGVNIEKMIAWLEKQGEQKPADNTEPKFFQEGDWVVYNNDICQIVKREEGCNKLVTVFGIEKELVNERNLSTAHLWTIQDAKDGDVLTVNGKPFIYYHTDEYKGNYCCIDNIGCFRTNIRFSFEGNCILPATKEQRDLLFQKMKESGYTFDFEKKELKKIEDKEYNGEDYGIDGLWHAKNILEKTLGKVTGYQSDDGILEHKCAISAVKKLYEQKPAEWSEEDEIRLDRICKTLWKNRKGDTDEIFQQEQDVDWLKSLKERLGG